MGRDHRIALLVAVVLAGMCLGVGGTARADAAGYSFKQGTLTVRLDGSGSSLSFSCSGGMVSLTGVGVTSAPCTAVKHILVKGTPHYDAVNAVDLKTDLPNVVSGRFEGGGGQDQLFASDISWTFVGGAGQDELELQQVSSAKVIGDRVARNGPDAYFSGVETLSLHGTNGDDVLSGAGFPGKVMIEGYGGDDRMTGGSKDDVLNGHVGDDVFIGGGGADTFDIEAFNYGDAAYSDGKDTFKGGPGKDTVGAWSAGDMHVNDTSLSGTPGGLVESLSSIEAVNLGTSGLNPIIDASTFSGFSKLVSTSSGSATLDAAQGGSVMRGDDGADHYQGNNGHDEVWLFNIPDGVLTDSGLTSATGNDTMLGVESAFVTGTGASDSFDSTGFSGPVEYGGDGGSDTVMFGPGDDLVEDLRSGSVDGGGGTDKLYASNVPTGATLVNGELQSSAGTLLLSSIEKAELGLSYLGDNTLDASAWTKPLIVRGSSHADTVMGGTGPDVLHGAAGDDVLNGGAGNDKLIGNAGADTLNGGPGKDSCSGGKGNNTFQSCELKF